MSATKIATRVSTLARTLDDTNGLMPYAAATTLQSVRANPDLYNRLQLVSGDSWRDYKPLYTEAQKRRGKVEAEEGTNVHMALAAQLAGQMPLFKDDAWNDATAALQCLEEHGWRPVERDRFVVTAGLPELVAGSFDVMVKTPGGLAIVDLKTTGTPGRAQYSALAWSIQLACYAHGRPYPQSGEEIRRDRYDRPYVDLDLVDEWPEPPRTDIGIVLEVVKGSQKCTPYVVDLTMGWRLAKVACIVRDARRNSSDLLLGDAADV